MDENARAQIGKLVIYVFLGVTVLLVLAPIVGLREFSDVKEPLQVWSSTYSVLVGAVIGYYFRGQGQ